MEMTLKNKYKATHIHSLTYSLQLTQTHIDGRREFCTCIMPAFLPTVLVLQMLEVYKMMFCFTFILGNAKCFQTY